MNYQQNTSFSRESSYFTSLFNDGSFSVSTLLLTNNIVEKAKQHHENFTSNLISRPQILKSLMDIALRPQFAESAIPLSITTNFTHESIELLSCLSEEFSSLMFDSGSDENSMQDEVLQEEQAVPKNEYFTYLLKILDSNDPIEETALSYLVRLTTPFCYHKPKKVISYFQANREQTENIFKHFYSRSIVEWVFRLLEIQDSNSFYEKQKLQFIHKLIQSLHQHKNNESLFEKLQNYHVFMETMLEKLDDRFEKLKFSSLIKQIVIEQDCLNFLFSKVSQCSSEPEIVTKIINIFQIYMKFSSGNRPMNPNTSKMSEGSENSVYQIRLNNENVNSIKDFLIQRSDILNQNYPRNGLVSYLKLVRLMNNTDSEFLTTFLSVEKMSKIFKLVEKYANNNILHNIVKQTFTQAINKCFSPICQRLLRQQSYYPRILSKVSPKNSKKSYENQIYHIFQAINKKTDEYNDQQVKKKLKGQCFISVASIIQEKESFYSKQIGGNPRKESDSWGDSSQQIILDNFFSKQQSKLEHFHEEKEEKQGESIDGGNEHWFDCNLPLDSDESKDESVGNMEKSLNECSDLIKQDMKGEYEKSYVQEEENVFEEEGSFNKHFESYLSFNADDLCSQIDE